MIKKLVRVMLLTAVLSSTFVGAASADGGSGGGGSTSTTSTGCGDLKPSSDLWPAGLPIVDPGTVVLQGKDYLCERSPLLPFDARTQLDAKYTAIGCTVSIKVNVAVYYVCPPQLGTNNHRVEVDVNMAALDLMFDGTNRSQIVFREHQL